MIHGICLNHRETFLASHVLCSIHHRDLVKEIFALRLQVLVSTGQPVARGEERIGSTTTIPMSERRPSTMNSFLPVEIQQNIWLDSKDYRYRNFSSISSPLRHYCIGRIRFRTHASSCSDCPSDAMLWIIKKSSRSIAGNDFPKF